MTKPELKKLIVACIKVAKESLETTRESGEPLEMNNVTTIAGVLLDQTLRGNIPVERILED